VILGAHEPFCWLCGPSNDTAREDAAPIAIGVFVLVALGIAAAIVVARAFDRRATAAWGERAPAIIRGVCWLGLVSAALDLSVVAMALLTMRLMFGHSAGGVEILIGLGIPLVAVAWLAFLLTTIRGASLATATPRRLRLVGGIGLVSHLGLCLSIYILPSLVALLLTGQILANPEPWNDRIAGLLFVAGMAGIAAGFGHLRAASIMDRGERES
jgi:hypothetical protein